MRLDEHSHMSTESDLNKGEVTLGVYCTQSAHAFDNKAFFLDRCLKALQAAPCGSKESVSLRVYKGTKSITDRSYSESRSSHCSEKRKNISIHFATTPAESLLTPQRLE